MPRAEDESDDVARLKTLLFGDEKAELAETADRLDRLEAWIGDAPRLELAASRVLVEAFKRAEIERHRELALAVAPVVVAAIRAEIVNSRDMMVEALYPIAGRMVAAAVANAFRELIGQINQRIDALTSSDQWRLRAKALASGRSVAEVALAEARGAHCVRAMLIERGGGRLLAQWRPQGAGDDNPDLIGGLIAAITEFAATVFADRRGELRNLDLGGSRVYLRASSRVILAAEMVGALTPEQERTIDSRFLALVDRNDRGDPLLDRDLADVATPSRRKSAGTRRLRWVVVGAVIAVCLGLALRGPVYRWRKSAEIDTAFQAGKATNGRLASYPLSLSENWETNTVDLSGLAPSRDDVGRLVDALTPAASPLTVASHIEVVAAAETLEAVQARLVELADLLAAEGGRTKSLADQLAAEQQTDAALRREIADKFAAVGAALSKTAAGASSALAAEVGALRGVSAQLEDGLKQAQGAARVEDGELDELGRNLGALAARLDAAQGRTESDLGAKAAALADRLTSLESQTAATARALDAASAQARDNAAKTEETRDRVAALNTGLTATRADAAAGLSNNQKASAASLAALKADLALVSQTLDAVKAEDVRTQTQLADEAVRARGQAQASLDLKRRLETLSDGETQRVGQDKATLDKLSSKVVSAEKAAADARAEVDDLRAKLEAATRSVAEIARRSIIYFDQGDTLADPAAAAAAADKLAEAIKRTGEGVRVIGYADEMGASAVNNDVSEGRATKIALMLMQRGVPAGKAIPVGRGAQNAVSARAATGSRNRRVVFEPLLPGEAP